MKSVLYQVIILNYNSALDCKVAVNSVCQSATIEDYCICIVKGGSTQKNQIEELKPLESERVYLLDLNENLGYARGNNAGIKYLKEKGIMSQYTVIMNPDVEILQKGTIEGLIETVENEANAIGAQPLVCCNDVDAPAEMQVNIRKVMDYGDVLVNDSWILKRIFRKKMNELLYKDLQPYKTKVRFEVPSGACFLIESNTFEKVGLFDEKTFLYGEEIILGYKIKEIGKCFVLNPKYTVEHYQGKSTGSHVKTMSDFSLKCMIESYCVYLRDYLKVSKIKIWIYKIITVISGKNKKNIVEKRSS